MIAKLFGLLGLAIILSACHQELMPAKSLQTLADFSQIALMTEQKMQQGIAFPVEMDRRGIKIDGSYRLLRGGSFQWFRLPESTWEDRIKKYKALGFNALDIYVAWNQVEPEEGKFNFDKPNLRRFLDLAKREGLFVAVRPGPYITNEMDGGGLPAWLTKNASKKSYDRDGRANLRTADPDFIEPVRRYLTAVNELLKPYMADQGGPIVLYVLENEYNWFERAFGTDRLFWYEGGLERPISQPMLTREYFTALRSIIVDNGVTIPTVTCPGDGKASASGDAEAVIPFPNIYEWANEGQPEEIAFDLLQDMHDPTRHNGLFVDVPSGSMELNRSTQEIRRLTMGGLDAFFAFNVTGMIQEGYMNSLTLAARAADVAPHWGPADEKPADWIGTIFDFSDPFKILNGFASPNAGYFGNVIDYDGAISSSGVLRDLFYQYRRDNFFFNTMEGLLGASELPRRSGSFSGADPRLQVDNPNIGARQKIGMVHYWHEMTQGTSLIGLVNQTGMAQTIQKGGLHFKGQTLPQFTSMVIPSAEEKKLTYDLFMLHQLPLNRAFTLGYSTSEMLTTRSFNEEQILVVYGWKDSEGELSLQSDGLEATSLEAGIVVQQKSADRITISYRHADGQIAVFKNRGGQTLRLYITNTQDAGHLWFLNKGDEDLLVTGLDFAELEQRGDTFGLRYQAGHRSRPISVISSQPILATGLTLQKPWDSASLRAIYQLPPASPRPSLPRLDLAWTKSDRAETMPGFDDSQWIRIEGEPKALEFLNIYSGHTWYKTTFNIGSERERKSLDRLKVESASDIVGIYVNGQYVTTMNPFGTEIDNQSQDRNYRFAKLAPYLHLGQNEITFRTEVWGHGSFMFGRGTVIGTKARMPALPYDGLKGLYGKVTLGSKELRNWTVGTQLGGERLGYTEAQVTTQGWTPAQASNLQLRKGDVVWYRTEFATASLPDRKAWDAPIVLNIEGQSSKATIFLNGHMLGRWLSDTAWIQQGFWGRPQRGMWVSLSPDQYPLPYEMLRQDGQPNTLAIVFEDCSTSSTPAGVIRDISLQYNQEGIKWQGSGIQRFEGIRSIGFIPVRQIQTF